MRDITFMYHPYMLHITRMQREELVILLSFKRLALFYALVLSFVTLTPACAFLCVNVQHAKVPLCGSKIESEMFPSFAP